MTGHQARRPAPRTFWNRRRTPCYRVIVRIGASRTPETSWTKEQGLIGTERSAVQVWPQGMAREAIYLDDMDGSAWQLVTEGRGDPKGSYRLLDAEEVLEDLTEYR
jgi:hypothetical protein